jgi:hypothetical protein
MIENIDRSRKELIEMVDWKAPTYFIGYGSLMYPHGINGRGMKKDYKWTDLIPVILKDFKRSFCATFKDLAFYGVYRDEGSELNAVAFEIEHAYDYTMLLLDEGAHPIYRPVMYNVLNVKDSVENFDFPENARVMVLETRQIDEKNGFLPKYYIEHTWEGIKPWGKKFTDKFLATGGIKYDPDEFDKAVKNPWREGFTLSVAERR